jgi:hypothetical protein
MIITDITDKDKNCWYQSYIGTITFLTSPTSHITYVCTVTAKDVRFASWYDTTNNVLIPTSNVIYSLTSRLRYLWSSVRSVVFMMSKMSPMTLIDDPDVPDVWATVMTTMAVTVHQQPV